MIPERPSTRSRRVAEAALHEEEEQFRLLALHLREVLWVADSRQTRLRYVSPAYEAIWGRSRQSLFDNPRSFLEAVDPRDRDRVIEAVNAREHTGRYEQEYRIRHPDGSVRWIWDRGYPVRGRQGLEPLFVGIAEDVTRQKQCEEDQARLAALVGCTDDAIISITLDGTVISWNQGAERLYGYCAEEMIGRPVSVIFTRAYYREYLRIMEQVRTGERFASLETVRRRKDGTSITVSVDVCPIRGRDGQVVGALKIAHDITRMKELEEQFRQAQKMDAIGRLAGGVAHDFNNLLTLICGYSDILLNQLPAEGRLRGQVQEIKKAGERGAALTRQLLAVSRKQVLEPRVVDLNAVVADCEKMLRRLVGEEVGFMTVLDPELGRVRTDPGQIEQVLMNLVINARDAMPSGGKLTIETANVILDQTYGWLHAGVKPGPHIMLAVSDTGCGMDETTKARIFEPFFTTKKAGEGTGLGLAMVYGFVQQCEGHIGVHSELGQGSTFRIYLPEVDPVPPTRRLPAAIEAAPHGTETVLVVEDEAEVRVFVRRVLETYGYTVLEAVNGEDALRLAETHGDPIHLVVSDVVMPELNGLQLAHRMEGLKPGTKVLFISGHTPEAVARHGLVESEVFFLQKPFTPSVLARKIRDVLDHGAGTETAT